jgi:hypothetical protein
MYRTSIPCCLLVLLDSGRARKYGGEALVMGETTNQNYRPTLLEGKYSRNATVVLLKFRDGQESGFFSIIVTSVFQHNRLVQEQIPRKK